MLLLFLLILFGVRLFISFENIFILILGFPGGARGKEPACQCRRHEKCVQFLGQEDPLEESMATHSSTLAWRILVDRGTWQATVHKVANRHD